MLRKLLLILLSILCCFDMFTYGQIEGLIVETYYVADADDATDTTGGTSLTAGETTYRIYVDLLPGSRLVSIFGDENHTLKIESTADFYNNVDRPNAYFGYLINHLWYKGNPTLLLDSWLTLGLATRTHKAVLKEADTDGALEQIRLNNGGSSEIGTGLLKNNGSEVGISIMDADGLLENEDSLDQWLDFAFRDFAGNDTTIFGPSKTGSSFVSNEAFLQQNFGVRGADSVDNKVLIAQLTTAGELTFELNLTVEVTDGAFTRLVKYVANDSILLEDEQLSPFLTYPPSCGCLDPSYIEYSNEYACNVQDSCKTPVVFGCLDTLACNYDPNANFAINDLCCYIGYCNDRDLEVVCPTLFPAPRMSLFEEEPYPNPASNQIQFQYMVETESDVIIRMYNAIGGMVIKKRMSAVSGLQWESMDVSSFQRGMYIIELSDGNTTSIKRFVKQ